jgi:hypothetical protein
MHALPASRKILYLLDGGAPGGDNVIARRLAEIYGIEIQQSTVNRWRNGKEPDGYWVTLALLNMAGLLNRVEEAPDSEPLEPSESGPLAELKGAVDGTFVLVQDVQARLSRLEALLAEPPPRRVAAARGTTRKARPQ